MATGHIDGRDDDRRARAAGEFEKLAAWKSCGDCSFVPVCAGGCTFASQTELGDMHAPTCHKPGFEAALVSLARAGSRRGIGALMKIKVLKKANRVDNPISCPMLIDLPPDLK